MKGLPYISAKLIYAMIAVGSLIFMFCHCEISGFWYDEFAQICYSGSGQSLLDTLLIADPTPPLFSVVANMWYDIMPYGERWLLLLPQLAVAGAVYTCGLWGECLGGRTVGIWSALLLGSSQMVIEQCGFEFRSYGFYLLFATLALYFHLVLHRDRDAGARCSSVWLCISLTGLLYSHLFGSLLFAVLLMMECAACLRNRRIWHHLMPYFISVVGFLPWAIYYFCFAEPDIMDAASEWMTHPKVWDVVKLAAYLCSNNIFRCVLLAVGGCWLLWAAVNVIKHRNRTDAALVLLPILSIAGMVIPAFLFAILRAEYSSLWVKRYFTGLFPCCAVLCGIGVTWLMGFMRTRLRIARVTAMRGAVCTVLVVGGVLWPLRKTAEGDSHLPRYFHREAMDYLVGCEEVTDGRALVLSTMDQYLEGLEQYYIIPETESVFSVYSVFDVEEKDVEGYAVVYLDYSFWEERGRLTDSAVFLKEQYVLDRTWEEICLERYVRK